MPPGCSGMRGWISGCELPASSSMPDTKQPFVDASSDWVSSSESSSWVFWRTWTRRSWRCDVFVLPSLYGEGMPMAVLEAMAMGRPVVASDIDGIRELLQDGSGLLVPPAHPRSLAEALSRLIASPALRVELALAGQQRQRRFHSVQVAQQRIFDVYRNLLRPSAS